MEAAIKTKRSPRIFWMGMHKVLKPTELRILREMGYEVFNPPYISPVYDQSADLSIDVDQPTTLPKAVFDTLMSYDFFYKPVEKQISDILNKYFDIAIVTINAMWLKDILNAFDGPIIYRTYGQHSSLSEELIHYGVWEKIISRSNFTVVPFADQTVEREHRWFLELCEESVPYQIPDDVFSAGSWRYEERKPEIAVSIPNIQNPFFEASYNRFHSRFPESYFRIYGPQRYAPDDNRIVGALPRSIFLERIRRASGYYYDYIDNVAYLPPIEMMEMRGPVICAKGSLLSRFLGDAPNVAVDDEDARAKLRRLMLGDRGFAEELILAQEETRCRYDRAVVEPAFRRVFGRLIDNLVDRPPLARVTGRSIACVDQDPRPNKIAVALHVDGLFEHKEGRAYAFEGIPRVVDAIVKATTHNPDVTCEIACTRRAAPIMFDFFDNERRSGAVCFRTIDAPKGRDNPASLLERLKWIQDVDADESVTTMLVPHYYLFPEALRSEKRLALYLPDYFPHLVPDEVFDVSAEKDARNKNVGLAIAEKADKILTNSDFTRRYLPAAGFTAGEDDPKVVVAPLPFLGSDRALTLTETEEKLLATNLAGREFLLYPTANRPNKSIAFLIDCFAEIRLKHPGLGLVMTCDLNSYPAVARAVAHHRLENHIHLFPRASEGLLRWLYSNTVALVLTSIIEGNFPPQVLEALNYGAPVLATGLPTIHDLLGADVDKLQLFPPRDKKGFLAGFEHIVQNRDTVLDNQRKVVEMLKSWNSPEAFRSRLGLIFPEIEQATAG